MSDSSNPSFKEDNNSDIEDVSEKYDPSTNTQMDVNTWIASLMTEIELAEYFNHDLFDVFKEEFINFDTVQFKKCSDIILRKLKNFLFDRGVFIRKANISHSKALSEILEKNENMWPSNTVNPSEHIGSFKTNNFVSPKLAQYQKNVKGYFKKKEYSKIQNTADKGNEDKNNCMEIVDIESNGDHKSQLNFKITGLSKLYNISGKYSGSKNDNLSFKFNIFQQKCKIVNITDENDLASSIFIMFVDEALEFYHLRCGGSHNTEQVINTMREQFEGPQKQRNAQTEWNKTTLRAFSLKYPDKSLPNVFEIMVKQLRKMQLCLRSNFQDEITLRDKILEAVSNTPECQSACLMPEESLSSMINNIRGAIGMSASHESNVDEAMFVNRKFHNEKRNGFQNKNSRFEQSYNQPTKSFDPRIKRCYCCKKIGCRSWRHTEKEQRDAKERFYQRHTSDNQKKFQQFLIEYEGITDDDLDEETMILDKTSVEDNEEPISGLFITAQDYDYSDQETNQTYTTSQYINNDDTFNISLLSFLQDQSVFHAITGKIPLAYKRLSNRKERYNDEQWQGVMIDTGAGKYSTAGYRQYIAYTRNFGPAELNTTIKVSVAFGKGSTCNSLGFIKICTPIGKVDFHILDSETPFLLCIADMKRLNVYLNNLDDKIYSKQLTIHGETYKQISSVKMKFGHPFIRWEPVNYSLFASCFITSVENSQDNVELVNDKLKLTEQQIRRLHKRFGHASVSKLGNLLDRAGYIKFRHHLLKIVNNCELCQKHGPPLDDSNFL